MNVPMTKSQAKSLKKLLRRIVILRDKEQCAHCGRSGIVLHLSHVKGEGAWPRLKFEPLNVKLLCVKCHLYYWHKDVTEATHWFEEKYPSRIEHLNRLVRDYYSLPKPDYKKLKEEFEEMIYQMEHPGRIYRKSKRYERDAEHQ